MSILGTVLSTLLGIALIAFGLRDIFHTLFHPSGTGSLSSRGARYVWVVYRIIARHRPQILPLAGPIALVAIIATWTLALAAGWAFVYWPHLTEGFLLPPGLEPSNNDGFTDALYVSLVALGTLGYGEITPLTSWLRIVAPLEGLVGFALFTASISWILSVYPVLARRRHLAREIVLLRRGGMLEGFTDPAALEGVLLSLADQVIAVRGDLEQFPITFYFHPSDEDSALSLSLPPLVAAAREGQSHASATVRTQSTLLLAAVDDLAMHVAAVFLDQPDGELDDRLAAYSAAHLYRADSSGQ